MPCNSAHLYYDELQHAIAVPVLNIVTETLRNLPSASRVTLFATKPTFDCGVYQKGFIEAGCDFAFIDAWQGLVTSIISNIKSGHIDVAVGEWATLMRTVQLNGVNTIVSACTDLNVVARLQQRGTALIDSARCLAEAAVSRYLSERS
jgi:aspartate racemase